MPTNSPTVGTSTPHRNLEIGSNDVTTSGRKFHLYGRCGAVEHRVGKARCKERSHPRDKPRRGMRPCILRPSNLLPLRTFAGVSPSSLPAVRPLLLSLMEYEVSAAGACGELWGPLRLADMPPRLDVQFNVLLPFEELGRSIPPRPSPPSPETTAPVGFSSPP